MWDVHEYRYTHNDPDWFWWIVVLGVAGVIISLMVNNGILAIFFGLAAVLFAVLSLRHPNLVRIEISEQGIKLDSTMHYFKDADGFWIREDHHGDFHILLHMKRQLFPVVSIPIEGQEDIGQIRDFLVNYLPEIEIREPYIQRLFDELGF